MPGAILMTRLKVYDTVTPDGQRGGTPHVHLLCTEMYFVLSGTGFVEMIDGGGFTHVELN
jgi:mannose-6-phosphate isomerase-like protein (cupin superfamily)